MIFFLNVTQKTHVTSKNKQVGLLHIKSMEQEKMFAKQYQIRD